MAEGSAFTGSSNGAADRAEEHADAETAKTIRIRIACRELRTPPFLWQCRSNRWHYLPIPQVVPQVKWGTASFAGPSTIRVCCDLATVFVVVGGLSACPRE